MSPKSIKLLPPRWTPLSSHAEQLRLVNSAARFKVVPAGRRSGKTERAKRRLVRAALSFESSFPNPAYFAGAPTRDQAKRIYWDDLKALSPRNLIDGRPSESELTIRYVTGAKISVVGLDKPERIEGTPWDGGILDEYANMKKKAWSANVRPALSDRLGWCWLIGVPEGRNHYYDPIYTNARGKLNVANGGDWDVFAWPSKDILSPAEIAAAMAELDELTFQQEYEASFVNFSGQAYYPFNENEHTAPVRDNYNPQADLIFMFDFNVEPGTATIAQEMEFPKKIITANKVVIDGKSLFKKKMITRPQSGTGIIGEVYIPRNSNTPAVCNKLIEDWGSHAGRIKIYGDATGGSRGTAKTEGSDWDLIKKIMYNHFGSQRVFMKVDESNPSERARINAVNSRLKSIDGTVSMMVDQRYAPQTVKDFEGVRLLEGGSGELDKKYDTTLTHLTDGVGYYIYKEFPIRKESFSIQELKV